MSILTPEQRSLRASLAAHESWANTRDAAARTEPARRALRDKWVRLARERFGDLPPEDLARRADHLMRAHMRRMALESSKARRAGRKPPVTSPEASAPAAVGHVQAVQSRMAATTPEGGGRA